MADRRRAVATGPRPAPGNRGRLALRLVLAAAVLAALLAVIPARELAAALGAVPLAVWVAAPLAFLAVHLLGLAKWRLLVNAAGAGLPTSVAARCYYSGLFGNLFLPSVVGGDAVRAGLALRHSRTTSGLLLASVIDRLLDLSALGALVVAATVALPVAVAPAHRDLLLVATVALLLAAAALAALVVCVPVARLPRVLRRPVVAVRRAWRRLRGRPTKLAAAWLLGLALQLALLALALALGGFAGVRAPFAVWLFVWPLAKLAALAPVTQGGIGVREAASVALFQPFGVPAAAALAAGLLFEAALVVGSLVAGLVAAVWRSDSSAQR